MGSEITLGGLQFDLEERLNQFRRVKYLLETRSFAEAWDQVKQKQKTVCRKIVLMGSENALKLWIKDRNEKVLGEMSRRQLIDLARDYQIKDYSRLPKSELIDKIERHQNGEE